MWTLKEDHGPVDVSERHTDKAMYTGNARRFKFFSHKVFCIELQGLQRDITPQTASDHQFMEALRLTSTHLSNHLVIRNLPHTLCFRGPQSVGHRLDLKRLMFEPREVHPKGFRAVSKDKGVFPSLMCSECGKWRRVDDETLLVFSNETFFDDRMAMLEQEFLKEDQGVISDLFQYLRGLSTVVNEQSLEEFWLSTENSVQLWRA